MKASQCLSEAAAGIINRSAIRDDNGVKSMIKTVAMFNNATGRHLTESEGWLFLAMVKLSRSQQGKFHEDDFIDAAAYIALAGEAVPDRPVRSVRTDSGFAALPSGGLCAPSQGRQTPVEVQEVSRARSK